MRSSPAALVLALGASLAVAPTARAEGPGSAVVARAGAIELTLDDVGAWLATLEAAEQARLAKDPAALAQAVRTLLARRAILAEARDKEWDQDPAVRARLDRIRDEAAAELYLEMVSRPPDGYPGEAEVRAAYEANRAAFAVPARWRVAQIFVAAPRGSEPDVEARARARVEDIVKRLSRRGARFASIARTDSDEKGAAERGGELGWLSENQLVPGIRQVVTRLPRDGVSEPVRLEDGWHVLKVLDLQPASTRPLSEVRDALVARLRAERAQAARQAHLARTLESSPPTLNEHAQAGALAKPAVAVSPSP
jgi:parvulin-like peptidyl-prolyl isomerase